MLLRSRLAQTLAAQSARRSSLLPSSEVQVRHTYLTSRQASSSSSSSSPTPPPSEEPPQKPEPSASPSKPRRPPPPLHDPFPTDSAPHPDSFPAPAQPKFGTSQSKYSSAQDKLPLPWLDRPLGVPHKPLKYHTKKSREAAMQEWLDSGRLKEREAIVRNATKGYFSDFHALKSHGGKTWRAPGTMIKAEKALYFPEVIGTCLADKERKSTVEMLEGKVSVVTVLNSRVSEEHVSSFTTPTLDLYSTHPHFQLVTLNLQPNLLKHALISLFLSSLRSQIPPAQHAGYLLSKLDLDSPRAGTHRSDSAGGPVTREELGLHNNMVGYTYLVGPDGKIRWASCGFAEKGEREALVACTGVLLGRIGG